MEDNLKNEDSSKNKNNPKIEDDQKLIDNLNSKNDLKNKGDLKNEDDHKNADKVILITVPWPLNEKPLNQPGDLELWLGLAIFCRYGTDLIICISNQSIKYLCEEDS